MTLCAKLSQPPDAAPLTMLCPDPRALALRFAALLSTAMIALWGPVCGAQGAPGVVIEPSLYVEHTGPDAARRLEPGQRFVTGDKVVTLLRWRRPMVGGGFIVTNALPARLAYVDSAEPGTEVSVDGGRNWGRLGALRMGNRLAGPQDVTHLRWHVLAQSARTGNLLYSGVVR